ncbi:MAG: alpha-E domain-containing protein [Thiotrichales bacterium]
MLSRVAERIYWFARYLERAENTARLMMVYQKLVLDLPEKAHPGWGSVIEVLGGLERYGKRRSRKEAEVVHYVVADAGNGSSILASIANARENLRTTREIMPNEAWELTNGLYLYIGRKVRGELPRATRHKLFNEVIHRCQTINGMLGGSMNHGDPYQFLMLGRNLERADMTTRIVDVGSAALLGHAETPLPYDNMLWINVLRSLSAYQMYRQFVRRRINGRDVLDFLLRTRQFPRSLAGALSVIERAVMVLPRHEHTLRPIDEIKLMLVETNFDTLKGPALHEFMDELQLKLARLHGEIAVTWFRPDLAAA